MKGESERINVAIENNIFNQTKGVYFTKSDGHGNYYIGEISWKKYDIGAPMQNASIILDENNQQQFFNKLIEELKHNRILDKSEILAENNGKLEAQKEHLDDMRRLVFDETSNIRRDASSVPK